MSLQAEPYQVTDRRPISKFLRGLADGSVDWCARHDIHPNQVSVASMIVSAIAAICFALSGRYPVVVDRRPVRLLLPTISKHVGRNGGTRHEQGELDRRNCERTA